MSFDAKAFFDEVKDKKIRRSDWGAGEYFIPHAIRNDGAYTLLVDGMSYEFGSKPTLIHCDVFSGFDKYNGKYWGWYVDIGMKFKNNANGLAITVKTIDLYSNVDVDYGNGMGGLVPMKMFSKDFTPFDEKDKKKINIINSKEDEGAEKYEVVKHCTCDFNDLMANGCKCGGV